jgi:hypothetical protein
MRTLRVLVADDNAVNRKVYGALLRSGGHEVLTAEDGAGALLLMQQQRLDLVLMDVEMPQLDGTEVTRAYRGQEAAGERLPIVALTGHADQEARLLASGMDAVLVKPVRPAELAAVVRRYGPAARPFDHEDAVKRLDGQDAILREIVQVFAQDYPVTLGEIRAAVSRGDGPAVVFSAHKLAGTLSSISAGPAQDAARRLEKLGAGNPAATSQALQVLELRIAELVSALQSSDLLRH